ncbi:MAG: hypothetical protein ACKVRO_05560 [Micropepsaceae bacterium]
MKTRSLSLLFLLATAPAFAETPAPMSAATLLGPDVKGPNWTVAESVRSDGFVRLYTVETPYGSFQVNGQRRMEQRLNELRALSALEQMSTTKTFAQALGNAGLAPIRFGRDLILDPVETTGNLFSGVANMFDRAVDEVEQSSASRDDLVDSVAGVSKATRELAFELKVDPYTDFTPLRDGLADVARAMAAGDLSITAAISAIPGGAGVAVSATSTASTLANPIRDKSSAEIAALVTTKLKPLGVDEDVIDEFVRNKSFSPADTYAIAEALEGLKARNSEAFIRRAANADSADLAKFHRARAELIARHSTQLGTLKEFYVVREFALNRNADGALVAVFPFDDLAWTEPAAKSLDLISLELATRGETKQPILATAGKVSAIALAELKKRGWRVLILNDARAAL